MATANLDPIILELAPLPREQIGPFLLLGIEKTAVKDDVDAAWAQRLIWSRKGVVKTPLEDINWAREVVNDPDRRARADSASLNIDLAEGVLRKLSARYDGKTAAVSLPLDLEKNLADYAPQVSLPDLAEVRSTIPVPEIPMELPAVEKLLEEMILEPIDPWAIV